MIPVDVVWMVRRDMPRIMAIEQASFRYPWTEAAFVEMIRLPGRFGMVAECKRGIIGFMTYALHERLPRRLFVTNLAVAPEFRRQAVGRQMLDRLKNLRMDRIAMMVRESNLDAQFFLKSEGFRATGVSREVYAQDTNEDGYRFTFDPKWKDAACVGVSSREVS